MKGLYKLATMIILKNATSQVAETINTKAVVQLLMEKNMLIQKNEERVGTQGKVRAEVFTLSAEVEELKKKYEAAQEFEKQYKADLENELTSGKVKTIGLQVHLADATGEKQALETKFKDLKDELTNACNDLWSTDEMLRLTRS